MKILFVGTKPSRALTKTLQLEQIDCALQPEPRKLTQAPDWAIINCSDEKALVFAEKIRKWYPQVWLTLLVSPKWLASAKFQEQLLACSAKSEVLAKDIWESFFWFSFQKIWCQQRSLHLDTGLAAENTELRAMHHELAARAAKLLDQLEVDLELAAQIQKSLLPKLTPDVPGISLQVKYCPSMGSGGDYYDLFEFGDRKRLGLLLADSQSHSLAALLLNILLKVRLEEMKETWADPKDLLVHLAQEISALGTPTGKEMALLYAILDRSSLELTYAAAGNLSPIIWRDGKALASSGIVTSAIGGKNSAMPTTQRLQLRPGDMVLFATDGLAEVLVAQGKRDLVHFLKQLPPTSDALTVRNHVLGLIDASTSESPLENDVTLIQIGIDPKALFLAQA